MANVWCKGEIEHDDTTREANARLIAAAPEMLDALIVSLNAMYESSDREKIGNMNEQLPMALQTVQELIERATGTTIDEAIKARNSE